MYRIVTDTSANLNGEQLSKHKITVIPLTYALNGKDACCDMADFSGKEYYGAIRGGALVNTSQVPPQRYIDAFAPILKEGQDILFIGISSGVSGSFSAAQIASLELKDMYPDRKICLVDTLSASLGEGLLVLEGVRLQDEGYTADEAERSLNALRYGMCQVFTVGDLRHLARTGRLSNIGAIIGTALHIKPLLKGDENGRIKCFTRVRGRDRAIGQLAAQYEKYSVNAADHIVGIAHADCEADALRLASLINEINPPRDILTVCYEPVTGAHVGPDTLALFFFGDSEFRKE